MRLDELKPWATYRCSALLNQSPRTPSVWEIGCLAYDGNHVLSSAKSVEVKDGQMRVSFDAMFDGGFFNWQVGGSQERRGAAEFMDYAMVQYMEKQPLQKTIDLVPGMYWWDGYWFLLNKDKGPHHDDAGLTYNEIYRFNGDGTTTKLAAVPEGLGRHHPYQMTTAEGRRLAPRTYKVAR